MKSKTLWIVSVVAAVLLVAVIGLGVALSNSRSDTTDANAALAKEQAHSAKLARRLQDELVTLTALRSTSSSQLGTIKSCGGAVRAYDAAWRIEVAVSKLQNKVVADQNAGDISGANVYVDQINGMIPRMNKLVENARASSIACGVTPTRAKQA